MNSAASHFSAPCSLISAPIAPDTTRLPAVRPSQLVSVKAMVVEGEGRDVALKDGSLRVPPLEGAPRVVPTITAGMVEEEAEGAQVFEVHQEQVCSLFSARL